MTNTPRLRVHYTHKSRRPHPCPTCGALIYNATNVEQDDSSGPVPGALTICLDCGHASIFTAELLLRVLRVEELRAAMQNNVFVGAYAVGARARRRHRQARGEREQ